LLDPSDPWDRSMGRNPEIGPAGRPPTSRVSSGRSLITSIRKGVVSGYRASTPGSLAGWSGEPVGPREGVALTSCFVPDPSGALYPGNPLGSIHGQVIPAQAAEVVGLLVLSTARAGRYAPDAAMGMIEILSITLVVAAVTAWINQRFLGLPTTIGVMVLALLASLVVVALAPAGLREEARAALERIDFSHALLDVLLAFLLFAGALHVKVDQLYERKWVIGVLATVGVLVSTFVVGGTVLAALTLLGFDVEFIDCLIFGALISPTDPIAVLAILKRAGVPKSLETKIAGESLFNDGVGLVVFLVIIGIAGVGHSGEEALGLMGVLRMGLTEIGGAVALGMAAGWVAYQMLLQVDHYKVEMLVTLALCAGLYSAAHAIGASGPIAVVIAGLFIGNTGRRYAMSETTNARLDVFWELVDEVLNVVLFVLIGMEVLVLKFAGSTLTAGLIAVPLVLLARLIAVGGAVGMLRRWRTFSPHVVKILTWGGLRGGISVALALSLPVTYPHRDLIVTMTYVVVIFSIVVQGLTIGRLVARVAPPEVPGAEPVL